MKKVQNHIAVFEHESIHIDRGSNRLTQSQLKALQQFYGESGVPYYSLIHNGVKFNEYVGVIMVGKTTIEILPKADKELNERNWRMVLIGMLNAVGVFDIHTPSNSTLELKANSILDLYFELFIIELEYLIHGGLIRKYRKNYGNLYSLKGSVQFSKHINKNLIHKERFFVSYNLYDKEHQLHQILYKALKLLNHINSDSKLISRINALVLDFPEVNDIKVTDATFDRITFDRKALPYKNAIEIAKLLLLNYHPDIRVGTNDVLALMFDMNFLWEQFVYVSLRKHKTSDCTLTAQNTKNFWKPAYGYKSKIKPDIVLNKDKENCTVLDTKWKNLKGYNPSPHDLRQMFVYMKFYNASKVALVYPNKDSFIKTGTYYNESSDMLSSKDCSLISIGVFDDIRIWQKEISEQIFKWTYRKIEQNGGNDVLL